MQESVLKSELNYTVHNKGHREWPDIRARLEALRCIKVQPLMQQLHC